MVWADTECMIRLNNPQPTMTQARNIVVPLSVAFGILATSLALCVAGFGSSIWWASSVSTKLELLIKQGSEQMSASASLANRLTALELWQRQVDSVGSPTVAKELAEQKAAIERLREDFNMHKATSESKSK